MRDEEVDAQMLPLSDDLNYFDYAKNNNPLFAHYTSVFQPPC
jgi:hypothetical protein